MVAHDSEVAFPTSTSQNKAQRPCKGSVPTLEEVLALEAT
jgi:hypothetical protein